MAETIALTHRVGAVRRFNRYYTRVIGALQEGLLQSRFTLAEARVLYELAQHDDLTATDLGRELELDPGSAASCSASSATACSRARHRLPTGARSCWR